MNCKMLSQHGESKGANQRAPFSDISRISGPASYYAFQMPGTQNMMFLFGDYHFSYKNQCQGCDRDQHCINIADFIERVHRDSVRDGTSLDVFMEFPYVVSGGDARNLVLARVNEVFLRDGQANVKNVLSHIFGKSPEYIGIFSLLYRRFAHRFYQHNATAAAAAQQQRYHYADARFEFNVKRFLSPTSREWILAFHQRVPSVKAFRRLLEAFVLGHYKSSFQDEMRAVLGADITVAERSLSSKKPGGPRTLHKIAKQVHKLPANLRARLEAFIKDKLDTVCSILEEDIRYEDGVRLMMEPVDMGPNRDGTLTYIKASRLANYMGIFTIFMELIAQTIMMDIYLLARMLLYSTQPASKNGSTIVYAGDYHTGVYVNFLVQYLKLTPMGCHVPNVPATASDDEIQAIIQRCVAVRLGTCDLPQYTHARHSNKAKSTRSAVAKKLPSASLLGKSKSTKQDKKQKLRSAKRRHQASLPTSGRMIVDWEEGRRQKLSNRRGPSSPQEQTLLFSSQVGPLVRMSS